MNDYTSCPIKKETLKQLNMVKAKYGLKNHSKTIEISLKSYVFMKKNYPEVELK